MNLNEALKLIAAAAGDGKIIASTAFVQYANGRLHVTDGRQWASAPVDAFTAASTPDFCVRFDALMRATEREGAAITVADDGNVVVRYRPRGSIKLRPLADAEWPGIEPVGEHTAYEVPGLKEIAQGLLKFVGSPDGRVWTQAIHLTPDFAFAANNRCGARTAIPYNLPHNITVPIWTSQFLTAQTESPSLMWEEERFLGFKWANGLVVRTSYLTEDAPESVMTLMSNLTEPAAEVPEGLADAVRRLKEHGAINFRLGEGRAYHHTQQVEVDEEVDVAGAVKLWNADTMLAALDLATHLDLSGSHGLWSGNGYRGIFTGMHGG